MSTLYSQQGNSILKILLVIALIAVGGYLLTNSELFMNNNNESEITQSVYDSSAKIIKQQEFELDKEAAGLTYALPYTFGGALVYKLYLNENLIDDGDPLFGTSASMPINSSYLKEGKNILRIEMNPHPEKNAFDEKNSCKVALTAVSEDDFTNTDTSEATNAVARIECVDADFAN